MAGRERFSWLVLASAVMACTWRPTIPPVPSQGGPAWVELTTEHFTVWTDAPAAQGRALAEDLEHLRQVFYGVMSFHPSSRSRCFVIALRDVGEVHAFIPPAALAETWPFTPIRQPLIVLPIDQVEGDSRVVPHELAHVISFSAIPYQPRWFAEGLATYFETVRLNQHAGSLEVGWRNVLMLRVLRANHLLPIASLFACTGPRCTDLRWYATAWALFAYLLSERPKQFQTYMEELAAGHSASDRATWSAAFGKLTAADLDWALGDWLANGDMTLTTYRVQLRDLPIAQRGLGDADAYAARGLLRILGAPTGPMPPEVAQALAVDPTNLVARMILDATGMPTSSAVARKIVAAHPDDWRAWWLVAYADPSGHEMLTARRALCALLARNPAALPPGVCPVAPPVPDAAATDAWTAAWQAHGVAPPPPPTVFDPVPAQAQVAIRNLTHGAIDDATARRWVLGDIRRKNAAAWTKRHLRLDLANAGVLGPPGLNGTGRAIIEQQARGVAPADGPSRLPVIGAVIAIPRASRPALLTDYAIIEGFPVGGGLRWQLDAGYYRQDPTLGGIWYQSHGATCRPTGSRTVDRLCALVARAWTPGNRLTSTE